MSFYQIAEDEINLRRQNNVIKEIARDLGVRPVIYDWCEDTGTPVLDLEYKSKRFSIDICDVELSDHVDALYAPIGPITLRFDGKSCVCDDVVDVVERIKNILELTNLPRR